MAIVFENDAELRSVKVNESLIPEYSLSIMEDALYVAEAIEIADKKCSEYIGISELNYFETEGKLICYSEADEAITENKVTDGLKTIKDKLIEWAKKIWEAIKSFFDKILAKFEKMAKDYEASISGMKVSQILQNQKFGKINTFEKLGSVDPAMYSKAAEKFASDLVAKMVFTNSADKEYRDYSEIKSIASSKNLIKAITGIDAESMNTVKKTIIDDLKGEEVEVNYAYLEKHLDEMKKNLQAKPAKNALKKAYAQSRKIIDGYMTNIRQLGGNDVEAFVACKPALASIVSCMNTANSALLQAYAMQHRQLVITFTKIKASVDKAYSVKKGRDKVAESASLDQESIIESLFAF